MTQDVTAAELGALVRMAGVVPVQTSPLAGLRPSAPDRNTVASLSARGACSTAGAIAPEWRAMVMTLADPLVQVSLHVEGVGGGQYFGGAGGISGFAQAGEDQFRLIGGWSAEAIVAETEALMPWRAVPDAPPLRVELSVDEFTVLAALADAHRQEQLQACIDRRPARSGAVTRELAAQQVDAGTQRADYRWLISILSQFAPPGLGPEADHLYSGASALTARHLAHASDGALALNPDLQTFCSGFANVTPFLGLAVHAPWEDPLVKLFTRGVHNFWGIEYLPGHAAPKVRISRLGGRAMDALLRQHLSPLDAHADVQLTAVASEQPPAPVAPSPAMCPKCGRAAKPGARFCAGCGTSLAA